MLPVLQTEFSSAVEQIKDKQKKISDKWIHKFVLPAQAQRRIAQQTAFYRKLGLSLSLSLCL